jgi:hypothetical protein
MKSWGGGRVIRALVLAGVLVVVGGDVLSNTESVVHGGRTADTGEVPDWSMAQLSVRGGMRVA